MGICCAVYFVYSRRQRFNSSVDYGGYCGGNDVLYRSPRFPQYRLGFAINLRYVLYFYWQYEAHT